MQNNKLLPILTSIICVIGLFLSMNSVKAQQLNKAFSTNPLLKNSGLPYGAPDFREIKESDYLPAFNAAIDYQRKEIDKIIASKVKPTFVNTILPFEKSSYYVIKVQSVLNSLVSAHKTEGIERAEREILPILSDFDNEVKFNRPLFQRIKYVYDNEYKRLKGEDQRLLEVVYKYFVRSGALLSVERMQRMKELNKQIALLQQEFAMMLPRAASESTLWIDNVEKLRGLSEAEIAQCKKDAERLGGKAPYCIVLLNFTQQPYLSSLENRDVRKQLFEASRHRADGTKGVNTDSIVMEIVKLRAEMAEIMGYANYAEYSLDKTMAKNTKSVYAFLNDLITQYNPKAKAENEAIERYANKIEGYDFSLQAYDRNYYATKMKRDAFKFSADEVRPYFNLDSVLVNGVFYAANKVYGLTFEERKDIPTYHNDMKVYTVKDKNGKVLAIFYTDYFRRPIKRGGAWMSSYAKQSYLYNQIPLIYNVCNYAKAPEGEPTLLTWDETTTLFHEFGHALHGILSACKYNTLSGTAVARDFVEMPSQFNENFAMQPEIFANYAKHYKTGEVMPRELQDKMLASINYLPAYSLGENLEATCIDLAWHTLSTKDFDKVRKEGVRSFEKKALQNVGLLNNIIVPRYSTTYFNHIWGGGYAVGYYSYLWSEVLSENVAEVFKRDGFLNQNVGQVFRDKILSRGNTIDLGRIFTDFTGLTQPDASGLLKARGL